MKKNYKITLFVGIVIFLMGQILNILFSKLYSAYIYLVDFRVFTEFLKNIFLCVLISGVSVVVTLVFKSFYKTENKSYARQLCLLSGGILFVKLILTILKLIDDIKNFATIMIFVPNVATEIYGSITEICLKLIKDGSIFTIIGLLILFIASLHFILSKRNEEH